MVRALPITPKLSPLLPLSGKSGTAAIFCATFLRPEMLHIHRQIVGLSTFSPVVLTQKKEGDWPVRTLEVIPRSGFRFLGRGIERWFGRPWQISGGETRKMAAILRRTGTSVLHIFFGNVAVHMLPLLRCSPVPVVVSFHGSDVTGEIATPAFGRARNEMFRRATLVLCRSEQLARRVQALGCDPAKLRIMRTVLPPLRRTRHVPPADGTWHIVQAARLVSKKGLSTSLRAFAEFLKTHPLARFTIVGEGPLEGELRALAADLGLSGSVEFGGFLSQERLGELFQRAHIFLHPSETVSGDVEGIPNSLLEAMASGLPAVSTRHGGIPEVIEDRITGRLCPERDPDAVAAALLEFAADPVLYERISGAGADFVTAEFSAAKQIANIEALYREACATK